MDRKFRLLALAVLTLVVAGCAVGLSDDVREDSENLRSDMERERFEQQQAREPRAGEQHDELYFGYAKAAPATRTESLPDFFAQEMEFGRAGGTTFADLSDRLSSLFGFQIYVTGSAQEYLTDTATSRASSDPQEDPTPISGTPGRDFDFHIAHRGSLTNLLDRVASRTNLHWRWEPDSERVVYYRHETRTYELETFAGSFGANTGIDSALDENDSAAGNGVAFDVDNASVWDSVLNAIRALASPEAVIRAAETPGRVTIRDTPSGLARVDRFMDEVNRDLTRVILVEVAVLEVEAADESRQGIDFDFLFDDGSFSIESDSGLFSGAEAGTGIGAAVLSGDFAGSSLFVERLSENNHVNSVVRESVVTLNAMPVPVRRVTERGFVAETQSTVTDAGTQVSASQDQRLEGTSFVIQPRLISNSQILIHFAARLAGELQLNEFSTGSAEGGGTTLQIPTQASDEIVQRFAVRDGSSLVISSGSDVFGSTGSRERLLGIRDGAERRDRQTMIVLSPRILE